MKKFARIICLTLIAVLIIISQTACGQKSNEPVSRDSYYFDTYCKISIYDMENFSEDEAAKVIQGAFGECNKYEKILSKTIEGSDIYKINHAEGKTVTVSDTTIDVIKSGIAYGESYEGIFDITIGTVEELYDFHGGKEADQSGEKVDSTSVPSDTALKNAASHVDYTKIVLSGNTVRLTDPKMEIDLGGIAKGYIADRISDYLESHGVTSAIISFGGNIVCIGDKAGKDFSIGIQKPFASDNVILCHVKVSDKTVVSSGIYQRYFKVDDKIYHHILNPDTALPYDTDLYGVTITADKGHSADCDAMATICIALGKDKAREYIDSKDGYEALFVDDEGNVTYTDGFNYAK